MVHRFQPCSVKVTHMECLHDISSTILYFCLAGHEAGTLCVWKRYVYQSIQHWKDLSMEPYSATSFCRVCMLLSSSIWLKPITSNSRYEMGCRFTLTGSIGSMARSPVHVRQSLGGLSSSFSEQIRFSYFYQAQIKIPSMYRSLHIINPYQYTHHNDNTQSYLALHSMEPW